MSDPGERRQQRAALAACARELDRERHNLVAADLRRCPQIVFQQLANRLQWTAGPAADLLAPVLRRRAAAERRPWLRLRTQPHESAALLRTLTGHDGGVLCCAFSPDGRLLVSGGQDATLIVWDARRGTRQLTLRGHTRAVRSCVFSADGRTIASCGDDATIRLWNAGSGALQQVLVPSGRQPDDEVESWNWFRQRLRSVQWSPNGGMWLMAGCGDGTLRRWDAATGAEEQPLRLDKGTITVFATAPDGRRIAAGCINHVKLWDTADGALLADEKIRSDWINGCAFSPDSRRLIVGAVKAVEIWDAVAGVHQPPLLGHDGDVTACAFSPDGRLIVSGSADWTLRLWDAADAAGCGILAGHTGTVNACVRSPDGRFVASASGDATVRLWRAEAATAETPGHTGEVTSCAFTADGTAVVSASYDTTIRVWDAATGEGRRVLKAPPPADRFWEHEGMIGACAVSPDGARIATGDTEGRLRLWEAATGTALWAVRAYAHGDEVVACAFVRDGTAVVVASNADYPTLNVYAAASGEEIDMLGGFLGPVRDMAVSSDGRTLAAVGADGTLRLWDAWTGAETAVLHGDEGVMDFCAISPDGRLVASGAHGMKVRVWDLRTGAERFIVEGTAAAFAPGGRLLATALWCGGLRLWDTDGRPHGALGSAARGEGPHLAFSLDGRLLASAGTVLRVWDIGAGGGALISLPLTSRTRLAASFAPDGSCLCCADDGGAVFIAELCGALRSDA